MSVTGSCEARIGGVLTCGDPAIGLFARGCVHEHVREGLLCRYHAESPETGACRTCDELPGSASHLCDIVIAPVKERVS